MRGLLPDTLLFYEGAAAGYCIVLFLILDEYFGGGADGLLSNKAGMSC